MSPAYEEHSSEPPPLRMGAFTIFVANRELVFPEGISFEDFDDQINSYLPLKNDEMRCYRAAKGTKSEWEWKPLGYEQELDAAVKNYSAVGLEVIAMKKVPTPSTPLIFLDV